MADLEKIIINDTGFLKMASGTTAERAGYVVETFTASGAGTFSVPTGVTEIDVLVVGGGGAGGGIGGGGGAGGVVYQQSLAVSAGQNLPFAVGTGGASGGGYTTAKGNTGQNSTFGSLTALGGGGAGSWNSTAPQPGGGSGAGGPGTPGTGTNGGTAQQPSQSNPGATINAGFPGARGGTNPGSNSTTGAGTYSAGGGGGATAAGGHPSLTGPGNTTTTNAGRKGGDGANISITGLPQYYGGGGGGGSHNSGYQSPVTTAAGGLGGGGRGASVDFQYDAMGFYDFPAQSGHTTTHNPRAAINNGPAIMPYGFGEPGQRNTGGGGGGGFHTGVGNDANGGGGGPGVIVVRYKPDAIPDAASGDTRYNTDAEHLEIFNGTTWKPLKRTIVEFKTSGAHFFKVPSGVTHCDALVVAGGGSGGVLGGAGGAGGHLYAPNIPVPSSGVIPVYVGVGGSATQDAAGAPADFQNRKGQPSRFGGYEAYGGGAGSTHPSNQNQYEHPTAGFPTHPGGSGGVGSPGGSGGGAAYTHPGGFGRGVPGQGYPGGNATGSPPHGCGGGGGAGGAGNNGAPNPTGGPGGVGLANDITGVSILRAGGGGGGGHGPQSSGGTGGPGGGGGGGRYNTPIYSSAYGTHQQAAGDLASPGQENTGGGGGGSGHNSSNPYGSGGRGGPGIVIIRY